MEPASVLQALAPANELGIQIGQPIFHERATWKLGIFGGGVVDTEYGKRLTGHLLPNRAFNLPAYLLYFPGKP